MSRRIKRKYTKAADRVVLPPGVRAKGEHRSPEQIKRDRFLIAEAYLLGGERQSAIATRLGLDDGTIGKELQKMYAEWERGTIEMVARAKTIELHRIDRMFGEYWEAWVRSKQPMELTTQQKVETDEPVQPTTRTIRKLDPNTGEWANETVTEVPDRASRPRIRNTVTRQVRQRDGNPAFLQGMERLIMLRMRLLGLLPPLPGREQVVNVAVGIQTVATDPALAVGLGVSGGARFGGALSPGLESVLTNLMDQLDAMQPSERSQALTSYQNVMDNLDALNTQLHTGVVTTNGNEPMTPTMITLDPGEYTELDADNTEEEEQ